MKLYYLYHSAVCVFLNKALLIFDYFSDKQGSIEEGLVGEEEIKNADNVYVFASHAHKDHFNKCIFEWAQYNQNITYILDSTIEDRPPQAKTVILSRGEEYEDGIIHVQEFGSTDIGGSFYVKAQGKSFFHAGDLNNWHWKDEGNEKYSRVMEMFFSRELRYIRHKIKKIDYAFFPVDKRMGSGFDEGADVFVKTMKPKYFIPIHFVDFEDTAEYKRKIKTGGTKVLAIQKNGDRLK